MALWVVTITATVVVRRTAQAAEAAQNVVAIGPAVAMLGWRAVVAPFVFGVVALGVAFLLPSPADVFLGGGIALSQLAGLASGIRSLLYLKGLAQPNLAKGHVEYSSEMRYRVLSAEMLACAVIFAGLFAIFQRMDFAGAVLFQASTSLGYWRRACSAATLAHTAQPGAPPNGGPAERLGNSGVGIGPPSVS
jgi:hypothetical protein